MDGKPEIMKMAKSKEETEIVDEKGTMPEELTPAKMSGDYVTNTGENPRKVANVVLSPGDSMELTEDHKANELLMMKIERSIQTGHLSRGTH